MLSFDDKILIENCGTVKKVCYKTANGIS